MEIFILDSISNSTVNHVLQEITQQKESMDKELIVYINSQGGDVQAGYAIYELLKLSGRKIITYAVHEVFSCAMIIYLAGDERYATNYSQFMIHEPFHEFEHDNDVGMSMTTDVYKKYLEELEETTNEYFNAISKHTALTPRKIRNYINKTNNGDWFIKATQAEKLGIVTKIGVSLTGLTQCGH